MQPLIISESYMQIYVVAVYIVMVYVVGFVGSRITKTVSDYIIGNRKLNAYTTAFGAGASDMSGWVMMAFPGLVFLNGVSEIWLPIGLTIGAYLNWRFVATRLREFTQRYGNALTIPWYFEERFGDKSKILRVITSISIVLFFTIYIAGALVACAFLFQFILNISYLHALVLSTVIIMCYTSLGGFIAINWIDVFQGTLMLFALLVLPISIVSYVGGVDNTVQLLNKVGTNISDPFKNLTSILVISQLGWGLGYFGQPHILSRFMAARDSEVINKSTTICMSWMILSLIGAFLVGLCTSALFTKADVNNHEIIFLQGSAFLFSPLVSGICFAAVLSTIMSTVSAQLLVSSASLSEDIAVHFLDKDFFQKHRMLINRGAVFIMSGIAFTLAIDESKTVISLVRVAWAGLGASLGPVVLFSLYWNNMTKLGAILGVVFSTITVLLWNNLSGGVFDIYEIVPGFAAGCIGVLVGTFLERRYIRKIT